MHIRALEVALSYTKIKYGIYSTYMCIEACDKQQLRRGIAVKNNTHRLTDPYIHMYNAYARKNVSKKGTEGRV